MKVPKRIPQIITEEELTRIIEYILHNPSKMKNEKYNLYYRLSSAMQILIIFFMGLRPNSIRLIEIKHIDFKNRTLYIPRANQKTNQDEIFPIPEKLFNSIINYLKQRQKYFRASIYLFPSPCKSGVQDRTIISARIRKVLKELNISKLSFVDKAGFRRMSKNLYSLRHSFATRVYEKTGDIKAVSIMLGHHDPLLRQAQRYVHVSESLHRTEIMKQIWEDLKE